MYKRLILGVLLSISLIFGNYTPVYANTDYSDAIIASLVPLITKSTTTRYDRIKVVHDYLIKSTVYDEDYNTVAGLTVSSFDDVPKSFTSDGPLLYHKATCYGYAEAFKKFMDALQIPCLLVASKDHVWNVVEINGQLYEIDVTWDDPMPDTGKDLTNVNYVYFLKSVSEMQELHGFTGNITDTIADSLK